MGGGREGDEDAEAGPGGSRRVLPAEMLTRAHSARLDMGPAADKYIVTKSVSPTFPQRAGALPSAGVR